MKGEKFETAKKTVTSRSFAISGRRKVGDRKRGSGFKN